ncbi:MAG: hypothetical protein DBY41_05750 [Clostridium sp.]|nr:MAG: hypothetical protein DBY41_05750 [Clostridium sp.]
MRTHDRPEQCPGGAAGADRGEAHRDRTADAVEQQMDGKSRAGDVRRAACGVQAAGARPGRDGPRGCVSGNGCEKQDRVAAAGAADRGRTGGVTKAMKRTATRAKVWDARQLPAYLTPAEYAALIGVCPKTVQRMCRMGMLPATKVGPKLWRIDKNAALEKMKKPAGAENTGGLRVKAI